MEYFDSLSVIRGKQRDFYKSNCLLYEDMLGLKDIEIGKRVEQGQINTARWKQAELNLSTCTDDLDKVNRKIKRKSWFGNTKFVVGIGIGVLGTMLIMK